MRSYPRSLKFICGGYLQLGYPKIWQRNYYAVPFLEFYKKTTGNIIQEDNFEVLRKKHPHIHELSHDRLQYTLQILSKFGITPLRACEHLHLFSMNPITMENYGEILKECGFLNISPDHIIKYHTLVRSRTISQLKEKGLLPYDLVVQKSILNKLTDLPDTLKNIYNFPDSHTSILKVRLNVLERYLHWKLSVTSEEFQKYCALYLPLKHKPMADIQGALVIAENDIKFDKEIIRRNGFIISTDPLHTRLILDNVKTIANMDIRDVIKTEPALLKNNYNSIIEIRNILEEFRISEEAQRRCLKVYCMAPETVRHRLEELRNMKEYKLLFSNPRVLNLVVHKKKMMNRLSKIETAKKQCYSLNHLISSNKVFKVYIGGFGDKVCSRDLAVLISSSLSNVKSQNGKQTETKTAILNHLRRHKYWLHAALHVVDTNIKFLKKNFNDDIIFNNCQILLYPISEVENYINMLLDIRDGKKDKCAQFKNDLNYNNLRFNDITDDQIMSLVLYEIEKKYHFSGDGIWAHNEGIKVEQAC